jgi:hypothetical protein
MCRATVELHSADSALTTPPYKRESDLFFLALVRSCANFLFSLVLLKTLFLFQTPATRARKRAGTRARTPARPRTAPPPTAHSVQNIATETLTLRAQQQASVRTRRGSVDRRAGAAEPPRPAAGPTLACSG